MNNLKPNIFFFLRKVITLYALIFLNLLPDCYSNYKIFHKVAEFAIKPNFYGTILTKTKSGALAGSYSKKSILKEQKGQKPTNNLLS